MLGPKSSKQDFINCSHVQFVNGLLMNVNFFYKYINLLMLQNNLTIVLYFFYMLSVNCENIVKKYANILFHFFIYSFN